MFSMDSCARRCLFLSFILCLTGLTLSKHSHGRVPLSKMQIDSTKPGNPFVDEYGRVRVFQGINRVHKAYPWYPVLLMNDTHIDQIASWGMNVIRLGTMWSGVEIGPYVANQTYLNIMENIITALGKRGIYVILDMHQDALSSEFHSYDGAPKWLIDQMPPPTEPFPSPFPKPPSNWMLNYATIACGEAFENIYNNKSSALEHLGFFWNTVSKRFGKYANVLGYELINEPWPGNVISNPLLFIPGHAGSKVLQPFYDKLVPFIRSVDNTSLVFYEPVTWGMIFHGSTMGSGFSHVPGGDAYQDKSVLSFHYYCWFAGTYSPSTFPFWLRELCDHLFFPQVLSAISKDIAQTGGGKFLTEFGLCRADAPHNSTEYQECLSVLSETGQSFVSWTYWDSTFYKPDGSLIEANVKLFSRTYAMAISGTPRSSAFVTDTGLYKMSYLADAAISQPTIVFASPLHYPNGFTASAVNGNCTVVNTNYVEVVPTSKTGGVVTVVIERR